VTVRQLLSLESGVNPGVPSTGCGGPRSTWPDAVAATSLAEPGTRFAYGPFPFVTMGAAIERVHASESFAAYLDRRIFAPLGITVEWQLTCGDGKPQLAGGAATTARDWATFGEFIRLGGVHHGKRILPDSLIAQLFVPSHANPNYGMSWWLRGAADEDQPARGPTLGSTPAPAWLPTDLVMAAGAGKQRLYIIPSHELIIVRLGPVFGGFRFKDEAFLAPLFAP
jgi:CubicO group peptidase (beta-lactamase class C family)